MTTERINPSTTGTKNLAPPRHWKKFQNGTGGAQK
jgi:hypothetical protein